jgi:hypothetical protein
MTQGIGLAMEIAAGCNDSVASVMPAKAGIQSIFLDSLSGTDAESAIRGR